jgi:hypothetical protein
LTDVQYMFSPTAGTTWVWQMHNIFLGVEW